MKFFLLGFALLYSCLGFAGIHDDLVRAIELSKQDLLILDNPDTSQRLGFWNPDSNSALNSINAVINSLLLMPNYQELIKLSESPRVRKIQQSFLVLARHRKLSQSLELRADASLSLEPDRHALLELIHSIEDEKYTARTGKSPDRTNPDFVSHSYFVSEDGEKKYLGKNAVEADTVLRYLTEKLFPLHGFNTQNVFSLETGEARASSTSHSETIFDLPFRISAPRLSDLFKAHFSISPFNHLWNSETRKVENGYVASFLTVKKLENVPHEVWVFVHRKDQGVHTLNLIQPDDIKLIFHEPDNWEGITKTYHLLSTIHYRLTKDGERYYVSNKHQVFNDHHAIMIDEDVIQKDLGKYGYGFLYSDR